MENTQADSDQKARIEAFQQVMASIYTFAEAEFNKFDALKNFEIVSLKALTKRHSAAECVDLEITDSVEVAHLNFEGRCRPCPDNPNACCFG